MDKRRVLFVSSDRVAASILERQLIPDFEVHSAATDDAAFALLDSYSYACVVIDLCARSSAGADSIRLNALTSSVIAIVPASGETVLPEKTIACISDDEIAERLVTMIRRHCGPS